MPKKPDYDPIRKSKMTVDRNPMDRREPITVAKNGNADRRSRKYQRIVRNCGHSKY